MSLLHARTGLVVALAGTLVLGVWMRWALAGMASPPGPLAHMRHAHSHLGYFGLLFPLAWSGWAAAGVETPSRRVALLYAGVVAAATAGFLTGGYGALAIAGSTAVALVWLWSTGPLWRRMRSLRDPLAVVPLGLVASLSCVPPIALTLRSDPGLAHGIVATFLSGLLFLVIVPSAFAALRVRVVAWPLFLVAGALGALSLGAWTTPVSRAGLLVLAVLLLAPVARPAAIAHLRLTWLAVALGLAALALGWLPNTRPVALGAIHFLVLGPVLASTTGTWLPSVPPSWWWVNHTTVGLMSAALVAQGFGAGPWTWTASAAAGSAIALWWGAVMVRAWLASPRS